MKKKNHVILCRAIVNRPVGPIVVVLQCRRNLTQSPEPSVVEPVDLLEHIRIIQLHVRETDEAIRVFLDELAGLRKTLRRCQQDAYTVCGVQFSKQLFENGRLTDVVLMYLDELG